MTLKAVMPTLATSDAAVRHSTLWVKPVLVGQFEFVEWTEDAHLRHSRFVGLREDKKAKDVRRE
jgi:ATP-dependent DNA ligase